MGKNFGKNISKSLTGKYGHKRIDHAHQSITDAFKTSSKRAIQKRQMKLMVWLVTKLLTELWKFQKIDCKIIHRQLQISIIKKHQKKDIYLQEKDRKSLMIWD